MAVITIGGFLGVGATPPGVALSPNLSDLAPVDHTPQQNPAGALPYGRWVGLTDNLPVSDIEQTIGLSRMSTFFQDYYYRIHIRPVRIDLGVVAAAQTRTVSLWNAFPDESADLDAITFSQEGIEYVGDDPPVAILPLQIKTWDIVITTSGPPNIDAQVQFDFADVPDPAPIVITGTRAIQFKFQPEVPVNESWQWMTDVKISVDGTEQRAGLRGVPRIDQSTNVILDTVEDVRELQSMLFSASNRFWMPQFQYATLTTLDAAAGTSYLALNTTLADVRANEYLMLVVGGVTTLVQVLELAPGGVNLAAPLAVAVKRGTLVAPGSPSFINDNTQLRRYAVNYVGEISVKAAFTTVRTQFQRPGHTQVLTTFDSMPVLDKQPLANDLIPEPYTANTQKFDAEVGIRELVTLWDSTKVGGTRQYLVKRIREPEGMDYWKLFGDTVRGSLKNFLLPSFRPDLTLYVPMGINANSATFNGSEYAEFYFKSKAKRYLAFTTPLGMFYTKVLSVTKTVEGNSLVVFSPALPAVDGWQNASMISIMSAVRILNDTIDLDHYASHTLINFTFREAYP